MLSPHTGIKGLEGREPIGAVATIGIKGPSGAPIEKDRFHLVWVQEDANGRRPHHPQFKLFNTAPPEQRQLIQGQLVHSVRDECFEFNYRCQSAKGQPSHPAKVPFCTGNGDRAKRYSGNQGGEHLFREIACPAEKCEFRMGDRPPCKPWARFLFRVIWSKGDLPTPLCKYTTGSWNTIRNLVGFFDHVEKQAAAVGLASYSLLGMRFALQLTERTNAEKKSRFPVVRIVPLDDPIAFFTAQLDRRERIAAIEGTRAPLQIASLKDAEQSSAAEEAADWRNHNVRVGQHTEARNLRDAPDADGGEDGEP